MAKSKYTNKSKLSPKQLRFCQEYVIDNNGTKAAIRAGYSQSTAKEQASRMLTKVNIKKLVKKLKNGIANNNNITAEMVRDELAKCGFSNLQDYITDENSILDLSKIPRDQAAALQAIKVTETITIVDKKPVTRRETSFKLSDKIAALEKLGRHLGIFEKDNKQKESRISLVNDIPKRKGS